ncbi:hypothetical protein DRM94_14305 [Aeromonas taiwanensis]|uniref:Uncharacterized protein n=1 Tax=Aeromonas taiwanensis TaxID=633417 RepID=A0A5F0K8V8_9GAMM|nr:hypothetical protein [Aeromonas taiwanensis]TFF73864.1 hypothetical protein DRM93_14305 [Aeromonas taiwanensis]TFF74751.1 hypothetical protein DRM95_14340 [Aeromonas taiwanensis]TFF78020.1 hypothetical protein DRM94_14305 [Aeromonas taiwanensis]
MTDVVISKILNQVSFKIDNKSWKDAQNKIKRLAGMWHKSSQGFSKAMEQGRRASTLQAKATDRQTRTELKAYRNRKTTIKADQIRHGDLIKSNIDFRKQLQKTNWEFLKGSLSAKERAATIGALTKQYRQLNSAAGQYNKQSRNMGAIKGVSRGLGAVTRLGVAGAAAGVVGGGFVAQNQYNKIKEQGQDFEGMKISFQNTFGDRWIEISSIARKIADDAGADILETGKALTNYVSIVKSLGIETDQAIELYKKQSNMTASYGMSKDQVAGFQYGLMQTLASNTLEDFKQAMDWTPQIKADLLRFVKDTMGISQKEFMGNLTNGKYNFKDIWLKFVEATSPKYAQMSAKFKSSSIANDKRVGNELSIAIYRIFESSGFKTAMQAGAKIVQDWAKLLESNSLKIGEIFGNLYSIVGELSKQGFEDLSKWLQELTAEDIKNYFKDMKSSVSEFLQALKALAAFINDILPNDRFVSYKQSTSVPESQRKNYDADTYGKAYVSKERELLNSGLEPSAAARGAEQFALQQALKIPQPTILQNSISFNPRSAGINGGGVPSNFSGKLNLKIDAQVNKDEFNNFVDFKIHDNNMMQLNLLAE